MSNGIYCYYDNLRCKIVYVGKDSYIDKNERHKQHYQKSKKNKQVINKNLQNDNKSGRYSYAVLEQGDFTDDELNQKEISWIAFFNPKFCFTEGGDGTSGYKHTEESRKKMSKNNARYWKNKKRPKETCEKMSKNNARYWKNKKRPKETCEKISKNNARYWKDKKFSKEHCEKMSRAKSGANNPRFNPCIKILKQKNKKYKQGFIWEAHPYTPKKQIHLSSVDLQKCIEKVEEFIKSEKNVYGYTHYKVV